MRFSAMSKSIFLLPLVALLMLTGCTVRVVDFTIISTKNFDYTRGGSFKRGPQRVHGRDLAHWIIIVPTRQIDMKEAIDNAIESVPGCVALLDGVVYQKFWWIPYVYGQQSYVVEGTPLIDPSFTMGNTGDLYHRIVLDSHGKIRKTETITAERFNDLKARIAKDARSQTFRQVIGAPR